MGMVMQIRFVTNEEINALSRLAITTFSDTFGHLYPPQDLAFHLEKTCSSQYFGEALGRDKILVAEELGQLVGYLKYGAVGLPITDIPEGAMELHRLYLTKDFQGKGIGKQLMDAFLSQPEVNAAPSLYVGVWENNTRAIKFYREYGFEICGEYDYAVGQHIDHEWMMVRINNKENNA